MAAFCFLHFLHFLQLFSNQQRTYSLPPLCRLHLPVFGLECREPLGDRESSELGAALHPVGRQDAAGDGRDATRGESDGTAAAGIGEEHHEGQPVAGGPRYVWFFLFFVMYFCCPKDLESFGG